MTDYTFTDMAIDYSVDELDDLTDRKVAPEGIDGDRMARIVRARRGAARANRQPQPFADVNYYADANLWGAGRETDERTSSNRRMAAVGHAYPESMGEPRITSEMRHQII